MGGPTRRPRTLGADRRGGQAARRRPQARSALRNPLANRLLRDTAAIGQRAGGRGPDSSSRVSRRRG